MLPIIFAHEYPQVYFKLTPQDANHQLRRLMLSNSLFSGLANGISQNVNRFLTRWSEQQTWFFGRPPMIFSKKAKTEIMKILHE
jgi:hypothetical protein